MGLEVITVERYVATGPGIRKERQKKKYEQRSIDVAEMLQKEAPNITIEEKEPEIGCKYDNPSCDENQTCTENVCKLKSGCDYNNPECKKGLTCIKNHCILAVGCNWDNPPCEKNFECLNNDCVPAPGCANGHDRREPGRGHPRGDGEKTLRHRRGRS